jgi:hypothetical protein
MKCHEVDDKIRDYLVQESSQLDQKLRLHLAECDGCRSRYESLLDLEGLLRRAPLMELPPGYDARFHQRLQDSRGAFKAGTSTAPPLWIWISMTASGFSWIYWLILSFLLVLGMRHLNPAAPYLPVEFSNSNLPGLMAILPLALLVASGVALLQGRPTISRSNKDEN